MVVSVGIVVCLKIDKRFLVRALKNEMTDVYHVHLERAHCIPMRINGFELNKLAVWPKGECGTRHVDQLDPIRVHVERNLRTAAGTH